MPRKETGRREDSAHSRNGSSVSRPTLNLQTLSPSIILPRPIVPHRVRRRRPERIDDGSDRVAAKNYTARRARSRIPSPPLQREGRGEAARSPGMEGDDCKTARGGSQLRLVSLQAQNFKKLKLAKPLPLSEGIILITGLNESGKSTILDAVLYALFGRVIRPSKMPSNEDIISYGNGEAQVRLEFDIGENRYRVVREVHKTRPNRATLVEVRPNGTTKTLASSVKDVTAEIERLLGGITYDEIVASSVVAQKDLERLIKQRLDDRRKVINVFLNLESFNKVQDELESDHNSIEGTTRNPGRLTMEQRELERLQDQLKQYKEGQAQLTSLEEKVKGSKAELTQCETQFHERDALFKILTEYDEISHRKSSLEIEVVDKSRLVDNLNGQLAQLQSNRKELEHTREKAREY